MDIHFQRREIGVSQLSVNKTQSYYPIKYELRREVGVAGG